MASTLKHLRSSTADKRPTASGLADGQLAINTASGTPGLFFKDSASQVVKVGPVHVGPTPPNDAPAGSSGNSRGELWVDNSLATPGLNYYSGTAFVNLTPSGTTSTVGLVELATNAETQTGSDSVRAVTPAGLQSKVSDSVSTTSSISIASSTAVKTAYDLAAAALPASGGRVTGTLEIGPSGFIAFEGSSDDSFETFLTAVNPTADRTITFPNITGTLITDADTGTVTNTMLAGSIATTKLANGALPSGVTVNSSNIVDGSIVNADISASAAIAYSKLSLGTSIVDGDISTTAAIAGTKISPNFGSQNIVTTGNVNIDSGTFYVDAVNNRVGVGTTGPSYAFDVANSVIQVGNGTDAFVQYKSTAGNWHVGVTGGGVYNFYTGTYGTGALRMSLDASGNLGLGLGVVTSAWGTNFRAFQISPTVSIASDVNNGTGWFGTNWYQSGAGGGTSRFIEGGFALLYRQNKGGGAHEWLTASGGATGNPITFTQAMTLDASGNLGIGITSPSNTAGFGRQVEIAGTLPCITLNQNNAVFTTRKYSLGVNASGDFGFWDNSASAYRMYIDSSGRLGIGTTSPSSLLEVAGITTINASAASANSQLNFKSGGAGASGFQIGQGLNSQFLFVYDAAAATERIRLDSSGRLLVGTSSAPTGATSQYSLLTIKSTVPGGSAGAYMALARASNSASIGSGDALGLMIFSDQQAGEYAHISCLADGTAAVGDYPGRLVFSTTADGASSPTPRMQITNKGYVATYCDNVAGGYGLYIASAVAASSSSYLILGTNGATGTLSGTTSFIVATNGNVTNTNNSYGAISDIKLKENIVDATSQWSDIKSLQIRKYNFKEGQTHTQIGLIAQEVELVSPGLVSESPDRDADGNYLGTVTKSVNYSVLYMKAVKALQEAMERIEKLEADVAALKA